MGCIFLYGLVMLKLLVVREEIELCAAQVC